MTASNNWHFVRLWLRRTFSKETFSELLSATSSLFGVLAVAIELLGFFFPDPAAVWVTKIRMYWYSVVVGGVLIALYRRRPKLVCNHKINGRDVVVSVKVGDIFEFRGPIIVGTNTTFDTHIADNLISERSVQGIFTRKYFSDEGQLDRELEMALRDVPYVELGQKRVGKHRLYSRGTCVKISLKERSAYLIAITNINEFGSAETMTLDALKDVLANLWTYIRLHGTRESLLIPILGTGFGRLPNSREEVIREIILSFIAACSESTLADSLTIVITPSDLDHSRLSMDDLDQFLYHECRYAAYSNGRETKVGTPV